MPNKPQREKRQNQPLKTKDVVEQAIATMQALKRIDEEGRKSRLIVGGRNCSCNRCPRDGKCGKH